MNIFMLLIVFSGMIICYCLGAVPAAYLIVRALKGIDIREHGSGNVGATNASRLIGKIPALAVLFFDVVKGFVAVAFISMFFVRWSGFDAAWIKTLFGLSVVCGHIFNIFLNFKGGKGVATSVGVIFALAPWPMFIGICIFVLLVGVFRYVSLGSIVVCLVLPFMMLWSKSHYTYVILSAVLCVIIVIKHKSNIKRLISGRERKVFEKK